MFKKQGNKFLLFDFGRETIRGIIFQLTNSRVKIFNFQEQEIKRYGVFDGKDFELDIIKKPVEKIIKEFGGRGEISKFFSALFFASDILKAEVLDLSFRRQLKDKKIEKGEEKEISEFIIRESGEKLFEKQGDRVEILKKEILTEKISGYKVSSLSGLNGEELTFRVLIIFCPSHYFGFFEKIKEILGLGDFKIFHPVESLIKLRKKHLLNEDKRHLFIDIEEKNTLISFFEEGEVFEFMTEFPIGVLDFTKGLCHYLGLKKEEAAVLEENFSHGKLSPEVDKKIREIFQPSLNFWLENFRKKIKEKTVANLFVDSYIYGRGNLLPLFKEGLEKEIGQNKIKFLLPSDLSIENKTKMKFSAGETSSLLKTFCLS